MNFQDLPREIRRQIQRENPNVLGVNFILDADSYKLSHGPVYPDEMEGQVSYGEPRIKGKIVIPVGLQMWIRKRLSSPITVDMIDEAEDFAKNHGEPFDRKPWEYIVEKYNGFIPIKIKAVKEGIPIPSQNALYVVTCEDKKVAWIASYLETSMQRAVWYPTTIASMDYEIRKVIEKFFELSVDPVPGATTLRAKYPGLAFMLHDFGARGASSEESAQIGSMAHLVNFTGSDTISGIRAANFYYNCKMAAYSVPATEHSIQCSYGPKRQREYLKKILDTYAKPGAIVSIVLDGYDVYRESMLLCTDFKEQIEKSGARVVFRPDSGDPLEVIPRLLDMQAATFGYTANGKGYKVINTVGVIQGDGIDIEMIGKILKLVTDLGYSAQNLVFGSGGALLQKLNRDTYKFAQKVCAIKVDGKWQEIFKDPITDPGKKSKAGFLNTFRNRLTGEIMTLPTNPDQPTDEEWEDIMEVIYDCGWFAPFTDLETIRARAYGERND